MKGLFSRLLPRRNSISDPPQKKGGESRLNALLAELKVEILKNLSAKDLQRLSQTCKFWHEFFASEDNWQLIVMRAHPALKTQNQEQLFSKLELNSWRNVYIYYFRFYNWDPTYGRCERTVSEDGRTFTHSGPHYTHCCCRTYGGFLSGKKSMSSQLIISGKHYFEITLPKAHDWAKETSIGLARTKFNKYWSIGGDNTSFGMRGEDGAVIMQGPPIPYGKKFIHRDKIDMDVVPHAVCWFVNGEPQGILRLPKEANGGPLHPAASVVHPGESVTITYLPIPQNIPSYT